MRRVGGPLLVLALGLLALTGCGLVDRTEPTALDELAHSVPGDAEQAFFLDLKPAGEAGRHWDRIRERLEANPAGREGLNALLGEFRIEEYGLKEFIPGPAARGYWDGVSYAIVRVSDEAAVEDALLQHSEGMGWEREEFEGRTLYYRQDPGSWQRSEHLAWTVQEGLLYMTSRWSSDRTVLTQLQALLGLAEEDSLAELPSWQKLRRRLPETPMGMIFFNLAEQARRDPPAPGDTSLGTALGQQIEAIALAAVPEEDAMRVDMAGAIDLDADAPSELRTLLESPAVDPANWTHLPASTAIALVGHDASVLWPWMKDMFGTDSPGPFRDIVGLDLEADLASVDGPLTGEFALGITPPLPEQPISQGLTALQMLILTGDASETQMASVRAAIEERGAVFGPEEVDGTSLQTQLGTEPTGYAISYGFDDGTLLFGSSPGVIGQGVAAGRKGEGLVADLTFQAAMATLPGDPSLAVYLNSADLIDLAQANMTEEEYENTLEWRIFEVFEAISLGLQFEPDELNGVAYFFLAD